MWLHALSFPFAGRQGDGSSPGRAAGGEELSGARGFPLPEQQLPGEEDGGGQHGAALQRPASQARVPEAAAQGEGRSAHRSLWASVSFMSRNK
ncbi:hypothetical protein EYF80_067289 [Liparis tanakae]|uniref:Uncharacterized protein n=1 Tax=Liparis tanakae TaxID=230148 RepID=A0A4Z2E169_9TELE|nr:hypothetical protein EYF80_067289 [Liparis tanakae]